MVTQGLSQDQWATLDQINEALTQEYAVRREMLLTRADVTVQSLGWSDKAKVRREGGGGGMGVALSQWDETCMEEGGRHSGHAGVYPI